MKPLPQVVYRLHPKRGTSDCAIAALATYLRCDPEQVLIAASQVSKNVWTDGLYGTQMVRTAKRLGFTTRWAKTFEIDEDTGVLWVSYRDCPIEHIVFLHEGYIFDPDHNPISLWDPVDYFSHYNSYPRQLLKIED